LSWSTYKNTIETVLTSNNYREIPENKSVEDAALSHNNIVYRLQQIGTSEIVETTSNGIQYNHRVMLDIKFKNITSDERHVNVDSFLSVFNSIARLADYKGTISEPTFEDIDDKHTKGSWVFLFGEEIYC
jgi:hypothetical protein